MILLLKLKDFIILIIKNNYNNLYKTIIKLEIVIPWNHHHLKDILFITLFKLNYLKNNKLDKLLIRGDSVIKKWKN
jgi:hypothetical protein